MCGHGNHIKGHTQKNAVVVETSDPNDRHSSDR